MMSAINDIFQELAKFPKCTIAVAQAEDKEMLDVAQEAMRGKIAYFILLGNKRNIEELIKNGGYELGDVEIIDCDGDEACAKKAIELVRAGKADMPMKGLLPTATFMRAVLDKERGLRTPSLISQISIVDNPEGTGLNYITDCAMNISPDVEAKKQIIQNAVYAARALGNPCPKVGVITALETVNLAMPETLDAAILSKMCDRGQIKNCVVDGPFALDNAISVESAKHKGIRGDVAGTCDILLMSDIRMGNVLHKCLTYYAKRQIASVIVGTSSPIILTSRSDGIQDKIASIAFSSYIHKN